MNFAVVISSALYLLALINPASKVFVLSSIDPPFSRRELLHVTLRATIAGLGILLLLCAVGRFLLSEVFHVDMYSLKVAGGIVLFIIGLTAVRKGVFFEKGDIAGRSEISIVPLAAPLIAGPGTITAAISYSSHYGLILAMIAIGLAVGGNFVVMLFSMQIGKFLARLHAIGPLIRITGLVVAAVAVQMTLGGIGEWWEGLLEKE